MWEGKRGGMNDEEERRCKDGDLLPRRRDGVSDGVVRMILCNECGVLLQMGVIQYAGALRSQRSMFRAAVQ